MNIKIKPSFLCWFIPAFIFLSSLILRWCEGPFWLGPSIDPSYLYMMNSVYILDYKIPIGVTHPGITLNFIAAGIIWLLHPTGGIESLILSVYKNPEFYLTAIFLFTLIFYVLSLGFLGRLVYKKTSSKTSTLLIQIPSLLLLTQYKHLTEYLPIPTNVCAESLLIGLINLWMIVVALLFFQEQKNPRGLTIILGLLTGLALATKVTAFPLVLMGIILVPRISNKIILLATSVGTFALTTMLIWSRLTWLWSWIYSVSTKTGLYPNGQQGIFTHELYANMVKLFTQQPILFLTATLSLVMCLIVKNTHSRRFLLAFGLGIALFFGMIAKAPMTHYFTPALCLMGFVWFVFAQECSSMGRILLKGFLIIFLFTQIFFIAQDAGAFYQQSRGIINYSKDIYTKYSDCAICGYYRSSSVPFALAWADENYGLKIYGKYLQQITDQYFSLNIWEKRFDDGISRVNLEDVVKNKKCAILYGAYYSEESFNKGLLTVKEIGHVGDEGIYAVLKSNDKQAEEFLQASKLALIKGDMENSFKWASIAQQLGHPKAGELIENLKKIIQFAIQSQNKK